LYTSQVELVGGPFDGDIREVQVYDSGSAGICTYQLRIPLTSALYHRFFAAADLNDLDDLDERAETAEPTEAHCAVYSATGSPRYFEFIRYEAI
jgi:hypothetical protein